MIEKSKHEAISVNIVDVDESPKIASRTNKKKILEENETVIAPNSVLSPNQSAIHHPLIPNATSDDGHREDSPKRMLRNKEEDVESKRRRLVRKAQPDTPKSAG